MADRFPSIEELDQGVAPTTEEQTATTTTTSTTADYGTAETAQDLAARERAVLGEDAQAFESMTANESPLDADGSGRDETEEHGSGIDWGAAAASTTPSQPSGGDYSGFATEQPQLSLEESEPIKEWRERQELAIERRDRLSDEKRSETREKAKQAIDDFYTDYNEKKEQGLEQTSKDQEEFLSQRDKDDSGSTWQRIAKLVDLSERSAKSGARDKTRFRQLLLSLKDDQNAPAVNSY